MSESPIIRPLSALLSGKGDTPISGITADSREVKPGYAFVAIPGTRNDGLAYVPQAIAAGAAAIISEHELPPDGRRVFVRVANARQTLSHMAAHFYPRQPGMIVAVTGTSGKTSVAAFVRQIWARLGHPAASIGTVGVVAPWGETYGSLTTPDPIELHRLVDGLVGRGITHLVLEASSHGLDQFRLDGMRFAAAGFTNLSRDHLDYHPNLEAYRDAKLRLFRRMLPPWGSAVVEADHPEARFFIEASRERGLDLLEVGEAGEGIRLLSVRIDGFAQHLELAHRGRSYQVRLPLAGRFQVENALVAAGLCLVTGSEPEAVFAALNHLEGAKGRLDLIGTVDGALVLVDYAHKPDALEKALETLRPFTRGRLVVIFGCGGDRDPGKRPIMGGIAARLADSVIVTDDNPRSEDPASIRAAILANAPGAIDIADRRAAIEAGVRDLADGDVLLIAGKGHEPGQIVGKTVLPFSDHDVARAAINLRLP